jgi:prepilin-type N-terminal cleavage/methylation domain-containing protein
MKTSSRPARTAFSLLELLVVLTIIGIVTALAVRSLDRVTDQRRFEAAQRGLEEIEAAVLGSPDDRAADGSPTRLGFIADLARLPRAVEETVRLDGAHITALTLGELCRRPAGVPDFAVRTANAATCVPPEAADRGVRVAGGWRGPYLRLPLGVDTVRDGWGNPLITLPGGSDATARLLGLTDAPVTANDFIGAVRHLGANGLASGDETYDADAAVSFEVTRYAASVAGMIEVLDDSGDPAPSSGDQIVVRVFSPDPEDTEGAGKIRAFESAPLTHNGAPLHYTITAATPGQLTSGPRIIRAYRIPSGGGAPVRASAVKAVTLRAGPNPGVNLTIDRNFIEPAP